MNLPETPWVSHSQRQSGNFVFIPKEEEYSKAENSLAPPADEIAVVTWRMGQAERDLYWKVHSATSEKDGKHDDRGQSSRSENFKNPSAKPSPLFYVEVPSLASILKRPRPKCVKAEAEGAEGAGYNRITKGKGKRPAFVPLDRSSREATFTRALISRIYGGGSMSTFPKIGEKFLLTHGMNDFMFPNLDYNPYAPRHPGEPGLFFRVIPGSAFHWPKIQRVIVGLATGIWLYVGQYRLEPVSSLTVQEWLALPEKLRKKWITQVHSKDRGRDARASISTRQRLGREPSAAEVDAACQSKDDFKDVTQAEIRAALDNGQEHVAVWRMICTSYDAGFQRNLIAESTSSVAPTKTDPDEKSPKSARRQ